uniref:Aldehyde oxidase/xanthine dehydrogenase a/b hammerhead domain-containing protein n=2 Tax=Graphocephala atropunctata TaxID=36148 RepID=A0A1B6LVT9_9HEMI
MPTVNNDLFAAFVITKHGPAELVGLDPSKALRTPGVVAFFSAKDIPGQNSFTPLHYIIKSEEQVFADKKIMHAGQVVGLVVAVTQELADSAADLVLIVYTNKKVPVLDLRDVVKNNDVSRIEFRYGRKATTRKYDVKKVIEGDFKLTDQYHFVMETMTCLTVPIEDGLDVYCPSQWLQVVQEAISMVLNIPNNRINVKLRRIGGSFGLKLSRSNQVATACSLAAYLLQRPVRMVVKLETMMEAIGKRHPFLGVYKTGVNDEGVIQYLDLQMYIDIGSSYNDPVDSFILPNFNSVYDPSTWTVNVYNVTTDKATNIWMRAPGMLEAITIPEHILEHIAHEVGDDPYAVRERNFDEQNQIAPLIARLKIKSDYEFRKAAVEEFNKGQVWKKRGISLVPKKYVVDVPANHYATLSVYSKDGTVAICIGGVEMGQGINTKAAQVCAAELNIPLEFVAVKPTNNFESPNNFLSGGAISTTDVTFAMVRCCDELKRRLEPVREGGTQTWPELIMAAAAAQIDLKTSYMFASVTDSKPYTLFGGVVLEAEIDILTGEHKVIRVDLLEDCGKSLNPFIDIGQVEGAFVMGLGYFTSEEIIRDPLTGRVLTNRSLTYKVPGPKDIPIDLRVYLQNKGDSSQAVLGAKALSEPPLVLSNSYMFAVRQALRSARLHVGLPNCWLKMDTPFSGERIFLAAAIDETKYLL